MAAPDDKPARIRAFLALDITDAIRARLAEWGRQALTDPTLRPVPPANLHLTLCFVGSVPASDVPRIESILRALPPRTVPMTFAPAPVAKPRSRPRLFALDIDSPAAVELQAELQTALVRDGVYEPEKRPFWPHLTIAKVRTKRGTRRPLAVKRGPGELPPDLVHTFDSVRVALYRSNLRPKGAQYVSLASMDLPPVAEPRAGKR